MKSPPNIRSLLPIACILFLILGAISEKINPELRTTLGTKKKANVILTFDVDPKKTLATVRDKTRAAKVRAQKIRTIAQALENQAKQSQAKALEVLKSVPSLKYRVLWITNQICVYEELPEELINKLGALNEITKIIEDPLKIAKDPLQPKSSPPKPKRAPHPTYGPLTWGLENMKVPEVWSQGYYGQNVIVAYVGNGIELHDTNRENFVGTENFGWLAPRNDSILPNPDGEDGIDPHGTHVMGTMAGHNGIGVAPGARWMACSLAWWDTFTLVMECFQHLLCPGGSENGCVYSPHIVNNKWELNPNIGEEMLYYIVFLLDAFEKAGIFVVFGAGNYGPGCKTLPVPHHFPIIFSVGALNVDNQVADFSSSGPAIVPDIIKPELVAPGAQILTSTLNGMYASVDETNLASAHVAGVVALMFSKNPTISVETIVQILLNSTEHTVPEPESTVPGCVNNPGTTPEPEVCPCDRIPQDTFPNYRAGYGKLNALKAVNLVPKPQ